MKFAIDPLMSFEEVISYYGRYLEISRAAGKRPVSFLHFLTGRY